MRVGATGSGESLQQSRSSPLSLFVRSNIGAIRYSKIRVVRDEHVHGQARMVVHSTSYKYGVLHRYRSSNVGTTCLLHTIRGFVIMMNNRERRKERKGKEAALRREGRERKVRSNLDFGIRLRLKKWNGEQLTRNRKLNRSRRLAYNSNDQYDTKTASCPTFSFRRRLLNRVWVGDGEAGRRARHAA